MAKLVEFVPNFSEGRDKAKVEKNTLMKHVKLKT